MISEWVVSVAHGPDQRVERRSGTDPRTNMPTHRMPAEDDLR
jgi:hypothetical protein